MLVNFYMICFGRFILGFCCGVLLCATPKALDETVPGKLIDKGFGTSTNIMINLAFLALMIAANFMPEDKLLLSETAVWQYLFAIQVPFQVAALLLHLLVYPEETVDFNVKKGDKQGALRGIRLIYSESSPEVIEAIY